MTLEMLEQKIRAEGWFLHLGAFAGRDGFVSIRRQDAWNTYIAECVSADFGLPAADSDRGDDLELLHRMEWLPASQSETDPFHGDTLHAEIADRGQTNTLREARARIGKLVLPTLRNVKTGNWLHVGPTNLTEAAKQSLIFATRMAVAEVLAGRADVWCDCVDIYASGNWPCGRLPDRRIVVI